MNNKLNHIVDTLFLVSLVLGIALSIISFGCDYLRWNINLICLGIASFSAILISILNVHKWKIALLNFFSGISIAFALLFYLSYFYHPKVAETSRYAIRDIPSSVLISIDPGDFCLYEKEGICENFHSKLCSDKFAYELKDFHVYENWGVVSVFLELKDTWKKEWNTPADSCFLNHVCIIDQEKSKEFKYQIDSLRQAINDIDVK